MDESLMQFRKMAIIMEDEDILVKMEDDCELVVVYNVSEREESPGRRLVLNKKMATVLGRRLIQLGE